MSAIVYPGYRKNAFGGPDDLKQSLMQMIAGMINGSDKVHASGQSDALAELLSPAKSAPVPWGLSPGAPVPLPLTPSQQIERILTTPGLDAATRTQGLQQLAAKRQIMEPYKSVAGPRAKLSYWDKDGKKRTHYVPQDQYGAAVDIILQQGGTLDEEDEQKLFGASKEGMAAQHLVELNQKIRAGGMESLSQEEKDRYALSRAILTKPVQFVGPEGQINWTQLNLPGIFPDVPAPAGAGSGAPAAGGSGAPAAGGAHTITAKSEIKPRAMPAAPLQDVLSTFESMNFLNTMEENVDQSGLFKGNLNKLLVGVGLNQKAIDFNTAKDQYRLSAQAMIKGIPSDFDVSLVTNTMADLGKPESVNLSRIAAAKSMARSFITNTLSYYKGAGYVVTPELIAQAKSYGINVEALKPYPGAQRAEELKAGGLDHKAIVAQLKAEGFPDPLAWQGPASGQTSKQRYEQIQQANPTWDQSQIFTQMVNEGW